MNITAEEAKQIMDTGAGYIILDVRTPEEYNEGHIPNAICIPNEIIGSSTVSELSDKEQLILIYCRSGNRSKITKRYWILCRYKRRWKNI